VKLTRRALALLKRKGKLRVTLKLTAVDAAGNRKTLRKTLTLRLAARR
jgi:hypothetical protein